MASSTNPSSLPVDVNITQLVEKVKAADWRLRVMNELTDTLLPLVGPGVRASAGVLTVDIIHHRRNVEGGGVAKRLDLGLGLSEIEIAVVTNLGDLEGVERKNVPGHQAAEGLLDPNVNPKAAPKLKLEGGFAQDPLTMAEVADAKYIVGNEAGRALSRVFAGSFASIRRSPKTPPPWQRSPTPSLIGVVYEAVQVPLAIAEVADTHSRSHQLIEGSAVLCGMLCNTPTRICGIADAECIVRNELGEA
ncbi:hypothetical protein B0H16DRAFT_1451510 [Mycena metata]|uniref:Uncharacterized protein n=1 Tax=Mycena metata TaxID=1033252 RepID=A0AAD7JX93_9AGAR|nr:hypothetical protein B0H16DRAFT_1451510 [Mycena metata]